MAKRPLDDPQRWGIPVEAVQGLPDELQDFWGRYRSDFRTRTRDGSGHALSYLRGQLTVESEHNYTNMERELAQGDGQKLQQFMSDSPWEAAAVYRRIRSEITDHPLLAAEEGWLIIDESADAKAGDQSAGATRQHNGRLGKVDQCQVGVLLTYAAPHRRLWAVVDGELYLPQGWFAEDQAELRHKLGIPTERTFQTKPELAETMLRRVKAEGVLPVQGVAFDDLYGRKSELRRVVDQELHWEYAAEVPEDTLVYLQRPAKTMPGEPAPTGAVTVEALAHKRTAIWQPVVVRPCERGLLQADFLVKRIWTRTAEGEARAEWLVTRRDPEGRLTYVLSNAAKATPKAQVIQHSCQRYVVERTIEDCKSDLGWDDLEARKYRAWEHHLAMTAMALWFVGTVKLKWQREYPCDPQLVKQLELEVLPALSTANVRRLLIAVMPLPKLTIERAQAEVVELLLNRSRSTHSRLKAQQSEGDSG